VPRVAGLRLMHRAGLAVQRALCRDCCAMVTAHATGCARCGGTRLIAHAEVESLAIAHIDCDAFYAAIEKRERPELAGVPLIIGHSGGRGVVVTACYNARRFGVRSAMPMFQALALCPQAVVLPPNMAKYKRASESIRDIFSAATAIIEPLSLDEAYLDLTDAHRTQAPTAAEALALIAARIEVEVGITVSIGLAGNKFLAKLASELDKPRGYSVIGRAEAQAFLAPLAVRKIHGVGAVMARRMEEMGICTAADLQRLSAAELGARFGRFGQRLFLFAHGDDDRRVTPDRPVKSISAETTLAQDTGCRQKLRELALPLSERVAAQLVSKGIAARSVVLKLKTSRFRLLTRSRQLAYPTQRATIIFASIAPLIDREADGRTFRLIGVGVGGVGSAAAADPEDLFSRTP
jgi:DNA polymerase IV